MAESSSPYSFFHDFAQPAMLALARAGNRGCSVDVGLRSGLAAAEKQTLAGHIEQLRALLGRELNPNSPKQVQALLYDELKLPVQRKPTPGGKGPGLVTCDEEAIKKLRRIAPQHRPLLDKLIDYRGSVKRIAMLETTLVHRSDGEWYFCTSYNATGTVTGRISSSAHILGYGGNLQQQERGATRRIFVARPGMSFVKADGSQAEARDVAARALDEPWLEKFRDPKYDVHVENASFVYSCPEELIREEAKIRDPAERQRWFAAHPSLPPGGSPWTDSLRQRGKPVTHGANYKGGPNVAVKKADIPYSEAKTGLERYTRARRCLAAWWARVDETLRTARQIRTVWGRQRVFLKRCDESTLREAVAYGPQSDIGDLINHAFMHLDYELAELGGWPLLQAHDEIVAEVPKGQEERAAMLLKKYIEWPLHFPGVQSGPVVIPADLGIGDNWYDLRKVVLA